MMLALLGLNSEQNRLEYIWIRFFRDRESCLKYIFVFGEIKIMGFRTKMLIRINWFMELNVKILISRLLLYSLASQEYESL
jgi:hypothetical protein